MEYLFIRIATELSYLVSEYKRGNGRILCCVGAQRWGRGRDRGLAGAFGDVEHPNVDSHHTLIVILDTYFEATEH